MLFLKILGVFSRCARLKVNPAVLSNLTFLANVLLFSRLTNLTMVKTMAQKPIQETDGCLLAQVCKLYRARTNAQLDTIQMHMGQEMILSRLWIKEGLTHSELAEQLFVSAPTITNTLKRMAKAGLIERRPCSEDMRVSHVFLTDAGREIRGSVESIWAELDQQAFAGFSAEERMLFRRLLMQLQENLVK